MFKTSEIWVNSKLTILIMQSDRKEKITPLDFHTTLFSMISIKI